MCGRPLTQIDHLDAEEFQGMYLHFQENSSQQNSRQIIMLKMLAQH